MIKKNLPYIIGVFVLTWLIVFLIRFFRTEEKAVVDFKLPQETIDFFKGLVNSDFRIKFNPNPNPDDWDKYESHGMDSLSDDYFIVYYPKSDDWKAKAEDILEFGHKSVPELDRMMNGYPAPAKVNGRKVPVYLAESDEQFSDLAYEIGNCSASGAVGLFMFEYSYYGFKPLGILISDDVYESDPGLPKGMTYAENVFRHELNHFAYFYHFDFETLKEPSLWFTEGIAEYFGKSEYRIESMTDGDIDLSRKSSVPAGEEYWVGYTAMLYIEKKYSQTAVYKIASNSCTMPLEQATTNATGAGLKEWNSGWRAYIRDLN